MSFWEKGYNAVFITSFYRNPFMHSADDTLDKVNPKFFVEAARALVKMMVIIANE